jgi:hypothetical protein
MGMKEQSTYAAEGTAAHELSRWVRETGKPALDWKGATLVVGEYQFKVGKPMIDSVQHFVDDCAKIPGNALFEEMVWFEEWVPGGFGTMDDARLEDGLCTVTDFKHGTGVQVYAKDNSQMKLYALGILSSYSWAYEFQHFRLKICQPRLRHFEEFEISMGQLMHWAWDSVRPAAKLAMTPGAPIVAGSWCKFCPLKESCATRAEFKRKMKSLEREAGTEFDDLTK